ncbi:Na+/H+ antiporter subunit E [Lottiidibacillus patelloidae]|uniref:Na+/H+ antiporter subunit E n=1 Tax=Lottiidibacillus patelloidae TaxID=2670334 RepID=A0A263BVK6_9BACI|nr:Na+/H+ antiporter subunit E [Lottiidibacillus patelloidae]OZM57781.1 Na+/H+ antiporter subunit E [Lottiidibacillus patelloidae]
MAFQILINLVIAIIWMFLNESYYFIDFVLGYLLGIWLLFLLRRFIPGEFYFKRVYAIVYLIFLFLKELILANIEVLKLVYKPKMTLEPGIFALPTELKTNWEITLLANLITLTPGTLSVTLSNDNKLIYIHAVDISDVEDTIKQIKDSFEKAIMEVTR